MNTTGKPPRSRARPYVRHASFRPSRRSIVTAGIFMLRKCAWRTRFIGTVVRRRRAFKLPEREHTQGRAGAHGQRRWCQEHVARGCSTLSAGSRRCSTERNRGYAHAFLCTARKLSCRRACAPLHAQALTSALHRPPPAAVPVPCWHCYQGMSSWESVCMGHPADVAAGPRGCPVGVGFHPSFDPPYPGYDVDYPQNPKPQSA